MKSSLLVFSIILGSLGIYGQSLGQSVIPGIGPVEEEELDGPALELEEDSSSQPYIPRGISKGIVSAGGGTPPGTNVGETLSTTGVGQSTQQLGPQTGLITPRTVQQRAQQQAAQILSGAANRGRSGIVRTKAQQQPRQRFQRPQAKQVTRRTLPFLGTRGEGQIEGTLGNTSALETPVFTPQSRQQESVIAPVRETVSEPIVVQQTRQANLSKYISSLNAAKSNAAIQRQKQRSTREDMESVSTELPSAEGISSRMPYGAAERDTIPSQRREIRVEHVSPGALVAAQKQKEEEAAHAKQQQSSYEEEARTLRGIQEQRTVGTLASGSIPYGAQRDAVARAAIRRKEAVAAAEQARRTAAVRRIEGGFLAHKAAQARREEQWRQDRIAVHQRIADDWNDTLYPERVRLENQIAEYQGVSQRVTDAYRRLGRAEQAAWDAADAGERAQLVAGYDAAQQADHQLELAQQALAVDQAQLPGAQGAIAAARGRLSVGRQGNFDRAVALGDADVQALGDRHYRAVKEAYAARRALEDRIAQQQADIILLQRDVRDAVAALHPTQQATWRAQVDYAHRQALRGEYDEIDHATGNWQVGGHLVDTPTLVEALDRGARENQDELAARIYPFLEDWHEEYINTLNHVPPLALSKSLRGAEERGQDIVDHVLRVPSPEAPIGDYQGWSTELKDRVVAAQVYEGVSRLGAQAANGGDDVKAEARDNIVDHLTHSRVARDLAWIAYGTDDLNTLSYAQKGALIKAHLTATGRNPHDPDGETWDEAHYAALRAGVPGLLPFQEIIGRMRACKQDEEAAHADGDWDEDFDC